MNNNYIIRAIETLKLGEKAYTKKKFSDCDVKTFAEISGDFNAIHLDEDYASKTIVKGRVVHGMLIAALISAVIGTKLPGLGTVYISQNLHFLAPVRIGDEIEAEVEIISINIEKQKVTLRTICRNQNDRVVIDGEALVIPPTDVES